MEEQVNKTVRADPGHYASTRPAVAALAMAAALAETNRSRVRTQAQIAVPGPVVRVKKNVGRNEKCPCGSGRKFKRCCLVRER